MEFGTTEEDAFRREIVDLTGKGLDDLEARVMRTPLDPYQTFMDDPLRVLRLIRLGSKLGFDIDEEALRYMPNNDIRQALDTMITHDQINIKVFKMMNGPNPNIAFQHIFNTNLYQPVFIRLDSSLLHTLTLAGDGGNLSKLLQFESRLHLWTKAAYTPLAPLQRDMLAEIVKETTAAVRLPAKLSKLLESALGNFDRIHASVDSVARQPPLPRSVLGMAIRSWGPNWITQMAYVLLSEAVHATTEDPYPSERLLAEYSAFADLVTNNGLENAHLERPLLNGTEVQRLFRLQKGGPLIKRALEDLVAWKFDNPGGDIRQAETWLLSQRERLEIPAGHGR
jgi:tRNA nucleotidyltransferase (CCA-adding enzyme)